MAVAKPGKWVNQEQNRVCRPAVLFWEILDSHFSEYIGALDITLCEWNVLSQA
jgi:hypothetical protein